MDIKLLIFDVDGVLTDGKLFIGSNGDEYKAFHTQDGMGISLARFAGMKTAIITGRTSEAVSKRAAELKIDYVFQGIHQKVDILNKLINELHISLSQVCYIGDDINDLTILKMAGYSAAPNNAVKAVKDCVHYVAELKGGEGAVREVIDKILSETFDYDKLLEDYLSGNARILQ